MARVDLRESEALMKDLCYFTIFKRRTEMGELKRAVVSSRKAHFMFSVTRYRFTN